MKERPKPKENWESVIKGSRKIFKSEDYKKILRELDIPFTDETIKKIIDIQSQYCDEIQLINERPRMSEVCAMMRKIIRHGKKYEEWLRKIDDESLLRMAVVKGDINFMDDISMPETIDRSLKDVVHITRIAEQILEEWERSKKDRKPGRPFNLPIRTYIARLVRVFEEATGKRATAIKNPRQYYNKHEDYYEKYDDYKDYGGKFFDFVFFCINKIPNHPYIKNATLGPLIGEVTSPSRNPIKIS